MFNIIISQDVLERILTSEQKKPDKARSLLLELLQQQKIDVSPKLLEYLPQRNGTAFSWVKLSPLRPHFLGQTDFLGLYGTKSSLFFASY